jgi:hypothetical protein
MSEIKGSNGNSIQIPDGPANVTYNVTTGPITTEATDLRKVAVDPLSTDSGPAEPTLARAEYFGIVCRVVNGIVTPSMQILLDSVLGTIDASVPNKDQNRAIKHLLRKQFDDAYLNIQRLSYPDMNLGASGGEYYLQPNAKAFTSGTIRQ